MNLPDYNFLSAPLWLITVLHILTLTLHLAAMNFVLGGGLVLLLAKFNNKWQDESIQRFVKLFPTLMAATITIGVAPLLFVQLTFHKQVYASTIVTAWPWLVILAAVMFSYYFLYGASFTKSRERVGIYLGLAMLGMAYVSFVYSSSFSLSENPLLTQQLYSGNQSGFVLNPEVGSYLVRWFHMILGAITVGAFFVGWIGRKSQAMYQIGKKFFLCGMLAAMVMGLIYIFTLGDYLVPFMQSSGIWLVTVGFILSLGSLHFFFKRKFAISGLMVFVSMLAMVSARHVLRLVHLQKFWDPANIPIRSQWSVLIVFVLCFVLALGLIWYMLKLFFSDSQQPA